MSATQPKTPRARESRRTSLINTPLQWGVKRARTDANRFNGFHRAHETVETVQGACASVNTPLKWDAKERNNSLPNAQTWWENPSSPSSILYLLSSLLALLLLCARPAFASPSAALREYKAGQYEQSLKDYQQLLQRKSDDPRLHFNAGTAAYRNHKFDEAAKQFNDALSSPDLKLQHLSYYNRGNTLYYLGEHLQDPAKRKEAWENAVKDYGLSMKLNPQDADAKYNQEFVRKKLEELEKQQQQQQKNQPQNIQPSEEAKKAKAQADEAVRRREYAKALELMQTQLSKDQTTSYYSDFIQRLKDVNGVQDSSNH